jgi:hypothetical protein
MDVEPDARRVFSGNGRGFSGNGVACQSLRGGHELPRILTLLLVFDRFVIEKSPHRHHLRRLCSSWEGLIKFTDALAAIQRRVNREAPLNNWPVSDSELATAVLFGFMLIIFIVAAFRKAQVTRKEFTGLQNDVKRLSDRLKELQAAEQRRFLKELKVSRKRKKISPSIAPESSASSNLSPSSLQVVK